MSRLDEWAARLRETMPRMQQAIVGELVATGLEAQATARLLATTRLRVRTGRLRGSITMGVEPTAGGAVLHLLAGGPAVRYARIQDLGGEIRPVRGRVLAVPLPAAMTPAGVARWASPRDVPGGRWLSRRGGGRPIFVGPDGTPLFVGLDRVRIPARRYASDAMEQARRGVEDRLRAALRRVLT